MTHISKDDKYGKIVRPFWSTCYCDFNHFVKWVFSDHRYYIMNLGLHLAIIFINAPGACEYEQTFVIGQIFKKMLIEIFNALMAWNDHQNIYFNGKYILHL